MKHLLLAILVLLLPLLLIPRVQGTCIYTAFTCYAVCSLALLRTSVRRFLLKIIESDTKTLVFHYDCQGTRLGKSVANSVENVEGTRELPDSALYQGTAVVKEMKTFHISD